MDLHQMENPDGLRGNCSRIVTEDTASFVALCKEHVLKGVHINRTKIFEIK